MSQADYSTEFGRYCARKVAEFGSKFDASDLNPNFVWPFNQGPQYRVKVRGLSDDRS